MAYGYYPKLLKQYENVLPWLNRTTIGNQLLYFNKKCASTYVTASVPNDNTLNASFNTENTLSVSVPTNYHVSDSNFASMNKIRRKIRKEELK